MTGAVLPSLAAFLPHSDGIGATLNLKDLP
jgi:hypothetical protein